MADKHTFPDFETLAIPTNDSLDVVAETLVQAEGSELASLTVLTAQSLKEMVTVLMTVRIASPVAYLQSAYLDFLRS